MKFSLLTYNLFFNNAHSNLGSILSTYHPSVICLQEIATQEASLKYIEKFGYKLATYSNSFFRRKNTYGVATFFDPQIFSFSNSQSVNLSRSFYEFMRFIANNDSQRRTVLRTDFIFKKTDKEITVYNLHLAPSGTNFVRDKQIREAFEDLDLAKDKPIVAAGDFNYPYGRKKFEKLIAKYGLGEATNSIFYTLETRILRLFTVKLKDDYVLYKHIKNLLTEKIQVRHSDHFPIIAHFEC